ALGPVFQSRHAKMMPHLEFSDYDWAIYVDNRASLTLLPSEIIDKISTSFKKPTPLGKYLFYHPERSSVRDELDVCLKLGHINEVEWREILSLYERVKLPDHASLTHNAVMIHKMGDPATERAGQLWFELFLRYSKRDQLTLQVAEHLAACSSHLLDFPLTEIANWPVYDDKIRAQTTRPKHFKRPPLLTPEGLRYRIRRQRIKRLIRDARKNV
ncbi:MAG: hypothetical protein AAGA08_20810, partial [Pseudomonadota bacterium]